MQGARRSTRVPFVEAEGLWKELEGKGLSNHETILTANTSVLEKIEKDGLSLKIHLNLFRDCRTPGHPLSCGPPGENS